MPINRAIERSIAESIELHLEPAAVKSVVGIGGGVCIPTGRCSLRWKVGGLVYGSELRMTDTDATATLILESTTEFCRATIEVAEKGCSDNECYAISQPRHI